MIAERQEGQGDRQDAGPDIEADAEIGGHDSRRQHFQGQGHGAGGEDQIFVFSHGFLEASPVPVQARPILEQVK